MLEKIHVFNNATMRNIKHKTQDFISEMKAESSNTSTEKDDDFPPSRPGCGTMDPPIFLTNIILGIWFVLTLRRLIEGEENPFFGNPILLTFALMWRYVFVSADKSPKDSVYEYYHRDGHKASKLVCLGDSITQGAMSSSFVDNLRSYDACRGMDVVNAGLNAITSWTVANKVCRGDFHVVVHIHVIITH